MQGVYLAEYGLRFVKTCFSLYSDKILFTGIFFVCILFFLSRQNKLEKQISIYTLFLFLTIFNPILVNLFFRYVDMDEVYYRFFWLLPINFVIAYFCISLADQLSRYWKKLGYYAVCICTIVFLGAPMISSDSLISLPENLYKVSDEVLEISEYIHQDSDEESPTLAIDSSLLMVIRQYDPSLVLSTLRDYALCWNGSPQFQYKREYTKYLTQKALMDVLYSGITEDTDGFIQAIKDTQTDYLVFAKTIPILDYLTSLGITYVAETESYLIYNCQILL